MPDRIYTAEDWPHGMVCETCDQPFREGDQIHSVPIAMLDDGTPIVGDQKCPRCWDAEVSA